MAGLAIHSFFRTKQHTVALIIFIVAAVIFTYPLVFQFATHISSVTKFDGDAPMFLWNMWWFKHALLDLHQNPYHATTIMWPEQPSLAFHTLAPINDIFSLPFQLVFPPIVAFNIVTLLFISLNGFCAYLLAWRLTRFKLGSIVAGLAFAFCPALTAWSLGHYNLLAAWMLPSLFLLLFIIKEKILENQGSSINNKIIAPSVGFAVLLGMQYWNDTYYFFFACIGTVFFLFYFSRSIFTRQTIKTVVFIGAFIVVVFLIVASPLIFMQKNDVEQNGTLPLFSLKEYENRSPDVLRFFIPSPLNGLLKFVPLALINRIPLHANSEMYIMPVYVGLSLILFVIIYLTGFRKNKKDYLYGLFWLILAMVFGILTLGPSLFIADTKVVNGLLPYALISHIPLLNNLRVPPRAIIVVYLALSLLVAFVIRSMLRQKTSKRLLLLSGLILLLLIEFFPIPRQTKKIIEPTIYKDLHTPEQGVILEVPFGRANGLRSEGVDASMIQAYQIWHKRTILNGSVSRLSDTVLNAEKKREGMQYLLYPTLYQPPDESQNSTTSNQLRAMGISEIVLHTSFFTQAKTAELEGYILRFTNLVSLSDDVTHRLYRLR